MQRLSDTNMYFHSAQFKRLYCSRGKGVLDGADWPQQLLLSGDDVQCDKDNNLNWSYLFICSPLPFSFSKTHYNCTNPPAAVRG